MLFLDILCCFERGCYCIN